MYVNIIIKACSLKQCMEYILSKSQITDNAKKISAEEYWKEPGYFSINFEICDYEALIFDDIINQLPKGFGCVGISKYNNLLDICGTNKLFQQDKASMKCGDIAFINISEIEIALLDRVPNEDTLVI